jgi:hypothetical protein
MFDISSPSTYIPAIFVSIVLVFVSYLYKDAKKHTHENTVDLPYYTEIANSMGYIGRNIYENGRFRYRKHIDSEIIIEDDLYNSLRHAGVLYSMYMYEKYGLSTKYKESRLLASKYFIDRYVKKFGNKGKYIVLSVPEEEQLKIKIAKSGSAGMALCALSNLYAEGEIDLEILQGLGEFLLSMQSPEGDFYAYYDFEKKKINKEAEAVYYTGEAAAGLVYLYETDMQEKWLEAAKKAVLYLAKTGKELEMNIPFDSWAALAIEKMFKNKWVTDDEKGILRAYTEQMAIPMMSNQITNRNNSYYGAFKDNVRPCSLGSIMEGLASIYFCVENKQFRQLLFKSLSIGNLFLSKVQVKTGEQAGGLPNSANWVKPGVTPNASIIRIDNVQHVVTGWLKFQNILKVTGNY